MRVHRAGVNQAVVFPHVAQKLVPRLHPASALGEKGNQLELNRR